MPGPVPKSADERRRRNKPDQPVMVVERDGSPSTYKPPPAKSEWHKIARDWYNSLKKSGQSALYEPSDWMYAVYVAELMSRNLNQGQKVSSQLAAQVLTAATNLLATPGERRRLGVELGSPVVDQDELDAVADIDELFNELGA